MYGWSRSGSTATAVRPASVAGMFYPADPMELHELVGDLLVQAGRLAGEDATTAALGPLVGILVPHAGLVYSGVVAAAGWRLLRGEHPMTVVLLGTNHSAAWLDGAAAWEQGSWRIPLGHVEVDADLAAAVIDLGPPFIVDRVAHFDEHSIEVQLPLLRTVAPQARIVPLAVAAGTGHDAIVAGQRLGQLLATRRRAGEEIVLAISSDMAHYPRAGACARATETLLPAIVARDAAAVAANERAMRDANTPGLVCGMCGIEPTVLGLAALSSMGATPGIRLAAATSADAGGSTGRTVGYLAVGFRA
jgi:MEMO1 family protein